MKMKTKNSEKFLLFSIRKPYSRLIIAGKKTFELRKRQPKENCKYALLYETYPTKAIIGIFEINRIYYLNVGKIKEITRGKAYVSDTEFNNYYKGKSHGVAIEIKKVFSLKRKLKLSDIGINYSPQDFVYVEKKSVKHLIEKIIATGQ